MLVDFSCYMLPKATSIVIGRAQKIQTILNSEKSAKSIQTIQPLKILPVLQKEKKSEMKLFLGLRSPVGVLRAPRRFAAINGSKIRIESYPLLASSQHVGATAGVTFIG